MRRIVYDVAVSLDGFIAGPGGDISAFPAEGPHLQPYLDRLARYETVIMGRRTYEFGYRYGLQPGARAYPHMDHHVFSRSLDLPASGGVTVVRDDWAEALAALRSGSGGDIYLCGGGAFAAYVADLGLLDVLRLKVAPVVIGAGVPLFAGLRTPIRFERVAATPYDNGVTLQELVRARTGAP
jgi:dihydrofolate reductase